MSRSRLVEDRSLSEFLIIVTVSSPTSREPILSFLRRMRIPKHPLHVSDTKGRARFEKTPRSFVSSASINLGNKRVSVTVMSRCFSAITHRLSQAES